MKLICKESHLHQLMIINSPKLTHTIERHLESTPLHLLRLLFPCFFPYFSIFLPSFLA